MPQERNFYRVYFYDHHWYIDPSTLREQGLKA